MTSAPSRPINQQLFFLLLGWFLIKAASIISLCFEKLAASRKMGMKDLSREMNAEHRYRMKNT